MEYHPEKLFNSIANDYILARGHFDNSLQLSTLTAKLLPLQTKRIMELGCGGGAPVLKHFYDLGAETWGVDFSSAMIEAAKKELPHANLINEDMLKVDLMENHFDAILSFYTIFLLKIHDQFTMFQRIYRALKPGGLAYFSLLSETATQTKEFAGMINFMGTDFYFCHTTPEKYQAQLLQSGFVNIAIEEKKIGPETCLWVQCEKMKE